MAETGLNRTFLTEHLLRVLYNRGRMTGRELADALCLYYRIVEELIQDLRRVEQIDIIGQKGFGDINYEYVLTPAGRRRPRRPCRRPSTPGRPPCPLTTGSPRSRPRRSKMLK